MKRGMSSVISTVILIAIVIVSISIVSVIIFNIINSKSEGIESGVDNLLNKSNYIDSNGQIIVNSGGSGQTGTGSGTGSGSGTGVELILEVVMRMELVLKKTR